MSFSDESESSTGRSEAPLHYNGMNSEPESSNMLKGLDSRVRGNDSSAMEFRILDCHVNKLRGMSYASADRRSGSRGAMRCLGVHSCDR